MAGKLAWQRAREMERETEGAGGARRPDGARAAALDAVQSVGYSAPSRDNRSMCPPSAVPSNSLSRCRTQQQQHQEEEEAVKKEQQRQRAYKLTIHGYR